MNYSYLSDGTKLSALDGSGEGLVYRGPFVYRKSSGSNASSSLTLESAAFGGGLMTPSGAMLYVTDYLGSVRAVVDGKTGELYKASDYSAFGDESVVMVRPQGNTPPQPLAAAVLPAGLTLRDGYTGKEAQTPDFTTGYTDFGARQYSPTLRRWMTPDPLSEKYYDVSPYAFCHDNPINRIDPDGRADWELVFKGTLITAAGAGTFVGGMAAIGGSGSLAAGIGVLAIISGKTSIGIGISMMTVGLISDPSNKTQEIKDELPTDLKSTLSKSADIILENENNEIENTVSIIFFAKDLFLFKPNSMENVVDYIKAGGDWTDRFLFFWDLYDQHDKQEQAEKEEFNENQSKE